jgi:hypothetical protein
LCVCTTGCAYMGDTGGSSGVGFAMVLKDNNKVGEWY